ncbi:MAG: Gfo/Idh/MocA family oxidoreductase [Victivallales bacterium]|nr:Gfo/Idh/MocA family oxidoreductase [Victivallales bacterium]
MNAGKLRVLVVGCGNMGYSHALAYHKIDGFKICGLVSRPQDSGRRREVAGELGIVNEFDDYYTALEKSAPDVVSVNTYPDSHAEYVTAALDANCHVFVEKPLASTVGEATAIVRKAAATGRKIVVGYILRHHPAWKKFVELAHTLGKPLVMRMNLNQQSSGANWETHKKLMNSIPPIVDCGVHYVDMMCLMTRSLPVRVQAIGARLSDELKPDMYNYGQLQVVFADGSVGWYEAGWGPMVSETAYFIKDVFGPNGAVSFVKDQSGDHSAAVDSHVKAEKLLVHYAQTDAAGKFVKADELLDMSAEPNHYDLCRFEQEYFLKAIREDIDLSQHLEDAVNSLRIVLAADRSFREKRVIDL